jgi:hypothetical protein
MVIVFPVQVAFTPVGKPEAVPIPVAPVVLWVIFGVKAVLIHKVVVIPGVTVFNGVTVIVPIAVTLPHPPVNGML